MPETATESKGIILPEMENLHPQYFVVCPACGAPETAFIVGKVLTYACGATYHYDEKTGKWAGVCPNPKATQDNADKAGALMKLGKRNFEVAGSVDNTGANEGPDKLREMAENKFSGTAVNMPPVAVGASVNDWEMHPGPHKVALEDAIQASLLQAIDGYCKAYPQFIYIPPALLKTLVGGIVYTLRTGDVPK